MRIGKIAAGIVACAVACGSVWGGDFDLQQAEFAKYYRAITGTDAPEGIVKFAIDPKISQSGRDAYAITSGWRASPPALVTITGSNLRSVWYGLYDLLERRGGCHWFWDGDVVPKRDTIDFSNLNVHEEARFEYRGLRYFAHRGLTRFQAEHWGPDDWKKEIDWILKRRLNVFMLRIGQDDLFQRTFPDACAYPDPSKPLPGAGKGYNDRSLFWSLQFRGKLRDDLQKYGFDRGLMVPEDYGTMTHWYAPTPLDYIENRKPPFYPGADKRPVNNRVWDVRDNRWIDEYWKMTKTAVETYGKGAPAPRLLHTIGTGERILSKDKKENFKLKVLGLQRFMSRVERDYPDAKLLMPGWDFYFSWSPQEVKDFLKLLDPKKCIVWDYSADQKTGRGAKSNFTKWDVIGKFPYTYSVFLAYEKALDVRADYPIIEERQKLVQNDPFCKGFIFWPESSHTDTLLLRYFTANAWSDKAIPHGEVLDEFCASRYGKNAEAMKSAWKAALPASWLRDWTTTYGDKVLGADFGDVNATRAPEKWRKPVADAEKVFGMLAEMEWKDDFIKRDTIDIARMALDRAICLYRADLSADVAKWRKGKCKVESEKCKVEGGNLVTRARKIAALCDLMADVLALHTDYSLWESYQRLDAVEKIQNPDFSKTLFENASCGYCRSHQYELARHWYAPHFRQVAENLAKAVSAGDRQAKITFNAEQERLALKARPLETLKPTLPRTQESFRRVMRAIASALVVYPVVADGNMDLYLLIGQSNMAGRGKLTADNRVDTDRVFKLDAKGKWQVADEPIHFDKKIAGAGLAASFARAMADRDKDVKIGLIPCAVGGTGIDRWVEGGDLWSNAVARTRVALKSGKLKGILWHQGEHDATPEGVPVWGAKMESMVKSFRREFGDVPFVAGELGRYLKDFRGRGGSKLLWREINAQLHALEGKVPKFRVVSAEGLGANRDKLHFNTEALREFGRRYAAAFLELEEAEKKETFTLQHAEFAKYYKQITGKDAPAGAVRFAIDPKISKSGRDAYSIVSGNAAVAGRPPYHGDEQCRAGSPLPAVTITGSNLRSVWYGLYDLLERRGGCHWFWDGDVVPKRNSIDLSNLDVHEEAHFEYRAIRYFAHRGLTRFQAEHWGPDDWKKEIDWLLKRRLNTFMLRIGQDDLFQRTFPDTCAYPDPAKPLPGTGVAHDDRTLFWSLQYRGKLRDNLQKYAFARGLMVPEDFGTMTHWYSRTPEDFLAKKKPEFIPLANKGPNYQVPNAQVWNIRDDKWVDEYWKMTKTAVETYGKGAPEPRLLHTIGLGERRCYKDKKKNFDMKILALDKFLAKAHTDYPDAKVLLAGWDFYSTWRPNEVKALLPRLDPTRDIIWDYEGDVAPLGHKNNFTNWGLVGKFPYTYSMFLAYENALDVRANYPIIEERQKIVQNDPFCKGFILWPESSHTDPLALRYFTANAWSATPVPHGDVLDEFCASRYGANAELMKKAWKAALPASWLRGWGSNYARYMVGLGFDAGAAPGTIKKWSGPVKEAEAVFGMLADAPWDDEFVRRDAIDIARMVLDRVIALRTMELCRDIAAWRKNGRGDGLVAQAEKIVALNEKMADLLALHTDYSLWETYQRMDAIEKIRNPEFSKTLFENASCPYCRSHQYELARHWYAPHVRKMVERLAKAVAANDRTAKLSEGAEEERRALKARPLESLRPTLPRTEANFRTVLRETQKLLR